MSDERDPNAPDIRNLRALRPFVRGVPRGVANSTIGGKGIKVQLPLRPTEFCKICGHGYNLKRTSDDINPKYDAPCPECQEKLDDGWTAFTFGDRYCFGKSQRLADLVGKIVPVEERVMQTMEGKFKIETKFKPLPPQSNGEISA